MHFAVGHCEYQMYPLKRKHFSKLLSRLINQLEPFQINKASVVTDNRLSTIRNWYTQWLPLHNSIKTTGKIYFEVGLWYKIKNIVDSSTMWLFLEAAPTSTRWILANCQYSISHAQYILTILRIFWWPLRLLINIFRIDNMAICALRLSIYWQFDNIIECVRPPLAFYTSL